jgi:hypothetical protein
MPLCMNIELYMTAPTAVTEINVRKMHNSNTFFLFFLIISLMHPFAFFKARAKVNYQLPLI